MFGRQLKRDVHERTALFKGLASELVMHERIVTTEDKAKAIRATADKLVTKAKKTNRVHAVSLLQPYLSSEAVKKMMDVLAPRFVDRQGGYTRMFKLGRRFNDNAMTVRMEWTTLGTESGTVVADKTDKKTTKQEALPAEIVTQKSAKVTKKAAPKAKVVKKAKKEAK